MDLDSPFSTLINQLETIADPLSTFGKEVVSSKDFLYAPAFLNRQQLEAGIRSDGSEISPPYRPLTIYLKEQKGQPTDRVTLEDTGEFYADLRGEIDSDAVVLRDDNEKTAKLQAKYGEDILGLTDESVNQLTKLLLPIFEGYSRHQLLPKLLER